MTFLDKLFHHKSKSKQTPPEKPALPVSEEPDSLAPHALHDELKALITSKSRDKDAEFNYPQLHKLLPLLEASFHPEREGELKEAVIQALKEIAEEDDPFTLDEDPHKADELPTPVFHPSKEILEEDGTGVLVHDRPSKFVNWGLTIEHETSVMFEPHSVEAVRNIVKWAKKKGKKVRCAGFRHTWSDFYGDDGDVIVMLQPLGSLTHLPYIPPPPTWKSYLQGVSVVPSVGGRTPPEGHGFVKIMAGTTNDAFREWCFVNKTLCIPFNVIMVEVTFGGTNAPICHGAGLSSKTLSDLVVEVSYVDANGDVQTINDERELRAASGCFGLLGVVVSLTLQLDRMGKAELEPVKQHYALAIPPPKGYVIPKEVKEEIDEMGFTEKDFEQAREEFVRRCEEDYYLEWFWFPYQRYVWTNTWKKYEINVNDPTVLKAFPGDGILDGVKAQQTQGSLAERIVNWWAWKGLGGYQQAFLFGLASLAALPNISDSSEKIPTYLSEALHFRRGIQNFRVWDTEWEIPIPALPKTGKRDYELVQRAWWDGISAMYSRPDAPVRVALEMRLTGASDVILAPQRGNTLGTASIEVLTTLTTPEKDWKSFCQQVTDIWTSYRDHEGNLLNVRPHWAKQWQGLTVHGKPVERYIKEDAFRVPIEEFRRTMEEITQKRGSSVQETRKRFGNKLAERLFWS